MDLKVALAQIKTVSGDLAGNSQRIVDGINRAILSGVDMVVFPELAISGYNCGMLFNQTHFIENNIKFLHKVIVPIVPKNLVVVVGFVDLIGKKFDGTPDIQNSLAVIQDGIVVGKYSKILLANGGHHDDKHYFTPGQHSPVININVRGQQIKLGTVICEDTWDMDHERNIVREAVHNGAQVIVSLNQSYFYYGKQEKRRNMYHKHALQNRVPVISVNSIGVGDIGKDFMIYDGGSIVVDEVGDVIAEAARFEPDFKIVDLNAAKTFERRPTLTKYEEIYKALVFATKHIFYDIGLKRGQVHVSGGIDSSVVLPIVVEALGKENVIAISNPSGWNGDVTKANAQILCDALDVKLFWNRIDEVENSFIKSHVDAFGNDSIKPLVISTFDAVGRTVQGLAAAHSFGTGIIATGNHTELVLGWSNFHDIGSIGVMSLIGDLTKVEIFELARYINNRFDKIIIPKNLYDGSTAPAAELADANEDPWIYYVDSGICAELIREMKDITELVDEYKNHKLNPDFFPKDTNGKNVYSLVNAEEFKERVRICFERSKFSVFKTAQSAPIVLISPISRGFSSRETIINKYAGHYEFEPVKTIYTVV